MMDITSEPICEEKTIYEEISELKIEEFTFLYGSPCGNEVEE